VVKGCQDCAFLPEEVQDAAILRIADGLDCNFALQLVVKGAEHIAHPTFTKKIFAFIPAGHGFLQGEKGY
jgi:hypothetical protein